MTDIVERLRDTVQILATTQMNLSMEDWDKVSNAILDAAGAIKRLRDDNAELTRRETEAAAEIARLRAALEAWNHAVRIDVLMEGPRYMGVSGEAGRRAWEMTRAALG